MTSDATIYQNVVEGLWLRSRYSAHTFHPQKSLYRLYGLSKDECKSESSFSYEGDYLIMHEVLS